MNEMKNKLKYLEESNWMFENNDGLSPAENLPKL